MKSHNWLDDRQSRETSKAFLIGFVIGLESGSMIRPFSSYRADRAIDFIEVSHSGDTHRILLRRSPTARRFTLRIRAASRDAVLTMPTRGKLDDARSFAEKYAAWVGARIRRLPEPIPFMQGSIIPFRGSDHVILHKPDARGFVWTEVLEHHESGLSQAICVAGGADHVERRVTDFLKKKAKLDLVEAVNRHCAVANVSAKKVSLRDTSSRWGSCSTSGNLSFSWRLILAPPFVLDYLAAHEVAHLRHLNHSSRFWELTRHLCPQTDQSESWLSAHGMDLHRYGKC